MTDHEISLACAEAIYGDDVMVDAIAEEIYVDGGVSRWTPLTGAKQAHLCLVELRKRGWNITHFASGRHTILKQDENVERDIDSYHEVYCYPDRFFAEALAWVQGERK